MPSTLVDSNVIIDVLTEDPDWFERSSLALASCADLGMLVINPIIYAEVAAAFTHIEALEDALPASYRREPLPWRAGFLAGQSFVIYRRRGGARRSPLPDFYIGAHAAVAGHALLTRDRARYATYFPTVELVTAD